MLKAYLKDGNYIEFEEDSTAYDVVGLISSGLQRAALVVEIDGKICDLTTKINKDCKFIVHTFDTAPGKKAFWHTASHVLAHAVKRLYPNTKLAIGPAIENGFYYDFETETPFTPETLALLEAEMKKIIKEGFKLEKSTLTRDKAIELMASRNEPYKQILIEELPEDEEISFYKQGDFIDLCAGPHLFSVGSIKAFNLTALTGAYWKGDSENAQLTRIYGIAFPKSAMLTEYLDMMEEAKKRDHRKIGKELEIFTLLEEGHGFPFFLPKGMILRNKLLEYWREIHTKANYLEISTPILLNRSLWETSGHWEHYSKNMYTTIIDDVEHAIKPMNCPGSILVYKTKLHSYKDLPLRLAELGLVHRHELSGALHGLMRVRNFTQDDAHIFLTRDQIKDEIKRIVSLIDSVYKTFGFTYHIELSTKPEDSMGSTEDWDIATESLRSAIVELGYDYKLNEGDGAFYGPKLDFHLKDCIGRTWQCGTIQLDFQLPERFELEYVGADGAKHRPIMIHRVVFGSVERFIGILIENFAGNFPTWLTPVQVKVMPIGDSQLDYSEQIMKALQENNIRAEIDNRNEKIGFKIREAQLQKIPYMFVIGDNEVNANNISVRDHKDGKTKTMLLNDFIKNITEEINTKSL